MRRRDYLAGSAGVLGGLAGCSSITGDGSDDSGDSPTEVAAAFLEALFSGDVEAAEAYLVQDSQMKGQLRSVVDVFRQQDTRLEGTELDERNENSALVSAGTSMRATGMESRVDSRLIVALRRVDGSWRVEILTTPGFGGDGPAAPSVQFEITDRTEDDRISAAIFTHAGGDDLAVSMLSASVNGSTAVPPADAGVLQAGDDVVVPLNAGGDSIDSPFEVKLRWSDSHSGQTQTLSLFHGNRNSVGELAEQFSVE